MKKLIMVSLALLGFGSSRIEAQTTMDLKQCIHYALANNPNIQGAQIDIESARQKTRETLAGALPQVNGNARFADNIIKQVVVLPGEFVGQPPGTFTTVEAGTTYNLSLAVDASATLYNQAYFTGIKASKDFQNVYATQAQLTQEQVIQNVAVLYYQLQVTQQKQSVIEANLVKTDQLKKTIETQYINGLAKKLDLDRMTVSHTNLQTQLQQLKNNIQQLNNQLKYLMGMPYETPLALQVPSLSELEQSTVTTTTLSTVQSNLEYKIKNQQIGLYEMEKRSIAYEYIPTLVASAQYSYNGVSNRLDLVGSGTTATWYDFLSVGLTLRVPIFDGLQKDARYKQSRLKIAKSKLDLAYTEQRLMMNQANAQLALDNARNTIQTQKQNMVLAEEVYRTTQQNYQQGLASLTDVLNAETSLTEAQNSYTEALLNYKLAEIELKKSNGTIQSLAE